VKEEGERWGSGTREEEEYMKTDKVIAEGKVAEIRGKIRRVEKVVEGRRRGAIE